MAEVEPHPIGTDVGTLLLDMVAQHPPQRRVEKVRAGVVATNCSPPAHVDRCSDLLTNLHLHA